MSLTVKHGIKIAPGQTRIVPIQITQTNPIEGNSLSFTINLVRQGYFRSTVPISIAFRNLTSWNVNSYETIRATYFYATSHPTYFVTKPPIEACSEHCDLPILALRKFLPSYLNLQGVSGSRRLQMGLG